MAISTIDKNPLLDQKVIAKRLRGLRNGFACNAIEGNPLTENEKKFLEDLVTRGYTDDQITVEILKALKIES